jgi:hypothetical protein
MADFKRVTAPTTRLTTQRQDSTSRTDILKRQLRDYKPTNMVSHSVNKTALHPGGVTAGKEEHTEM